MGTLDTKINYEKCNTIDNTFSNADTYPKTIFTPPAGKRVLLSDVIIGVINTTATTNIVILVQAFINGAWQTIMPIGAVGSNAQVIDHDFGGRVQTDINGGFRLNKSGTSVTFNGVVTMTGRLA